MSSSVTDPVFSGRETRTFEFGTKIYYFYLLSGADPGLAPTLYGGRQHMILENFAKNCMKLRTFWAIGGHAPGASPLNPLLIISNIVAKSCMVMENSS